MSLVLSDQVDLSIRQFVDAWRALCGGAPGSTVATERGIEYVFSGIPIPFFNVAILSERSVTADALAARGAEACTWASTSDVPWLFVVTQECLEAGIDPAAVLDVVGLAPLMPLTGMVAQDVARPAAIPEGLHQREARNEADCAALLDVNSRAYAMDLAAGTDLIGKPSFWEGHMPVVGTVEDKAVSSAAVLMVEGFRYVALVATDPAQQRRGYAEAAMRRALELSGEAAPGTATFLHATEAGRPIYERMGYSTVAHHTVFMEKRFLAAH